MKEIDKEMKQLRKILTEGHPEVEGPCQLLEELDVADMLRYFSDLQVTIFDRQKQVAEELGVKVISPTDMQKVIQRVFADDLGPIGPTAAIQLATGIVCKTLNAMHPSIRCFFFRYVLISTLVEASGATRDELANTLDQLMREEQGGGEKKPAKKTDLFLVN